MAMANWLPTFNALKISKLFISAPAKKRWCYEIKTELKMPEGTARNTLKVMHQKQWLEAEEEPTARSLLNRTPRVLYRITEYGLSAACEALKQVQFQGTIILSS
jgi:DNA-binding PadR family transcriptional regulator